MVIFRDNFICSETAELIFRSNLSIHSCLKHPVVCMACVHKKELCWKKTVFLWKRKSGLFFITQRPLWKATHTHTYSPPPTLTNENSRWKTHLWNVSFCICLFSLPFIDHLRPSTSSPSLRLRLFTHSFHFLWHFLLLLSELNFKCSHLDSIELTRIQCNVAKWCWWWTDLFSITFLLLDHSILTTLAIIRYNMQEMTSFVAAINVLPSSKMCACPLHAQRPVNAKAVLIGFLLFASNCVEFFKRKQRKSLGSPY